MHDGVAGLNVSAGDDCVLLARARAGDSAAFDALYLAHYDQLWRFAYRHVRSADGAEDVVHDVFAALWGQLQTVSVRTTVLAYLMGAVHKRAIDAVRRQGVIDRTAASGVAVAVGAAPERPDAWAENGAARAAVSRAVAGLPPRQRLAVVLRWREQLRYVEIADALGVTEAAVRKLVDKAYVTLGRALHGWRTDGERRAGHALRAAIEPARPRTKTG